MRRDLPDFFHVEPNQLGIHDRLCNWAKYVASGRRAWQAPIWKLGRSNGRQWHEPVPRIPVDSQDGHKLEKAVCALPGPHREALRWAYIFRGPPHMARRELGVTDHGLYRLVSDARLMLVNRRV